MCNFDFYVATLSLVSHLQYVKFTTLKSPKLSCGRRKSNWIADRMKKLIKPKGGSKEGRALFIAAGSIENLADAVDGTPGSSAAVPGESRRAVARVITLDVLHHRVEESANKLRLQGSLDSVKHKKVPQSP